MQEILMKMNQLADENEILKRQIAEVARVQVLKTPTPQSRVEDIPLIGSNVKEPKLALPDTFDGDRKKSRAFLIQIEVIFESQPLRYSSERSKVLFAVNLLRGAAFNWIIPYLEAKHPITYSYEHFRDAFKIAFGDINRPRQAAREIMELKQNTQSATKHISDFQRLVTELNWSGGAVIEVFYRSLNDEVKTALCNYV